MPKTYKKRPKVFYRATVVSSESDVLTPAPVMTASRKKLAPRARLLPAVSHRCWLPKTTLTSARATLTTPRNESFNSLIWSRCPKTEFCSLVVVETSEHGKQIVKVCFMSVMVFNLGMKQFATLLQRMGHECNPSTFQYLSEMNDKRIYRAKVKDQEAVKRRRRVMRIDLSLMEQQVAEEGVTYGAGAFNWLLVQGFSIYLLVLFTQKKTGKDGLLIIDN